MRLATFGTLILLLFGGCAMVDVGVRNPVVGMTTIAIVPFFNLSQERAVDGRRFAFAYYTELQKTPGFQVIPVGVAEQAMFDNGLLMNNPEDVLKLAELLGADAVVVGAVTDYSPYYPPRIGLQVSWYSPRPWPFFPGIPTNEFERDLVKPGLFGRWRGKREKCDSCPPEMLLEPQLPAAAIIPRGQSPIDDEASGSGKSNIVTLSEHLSGIPAAPVAADDPSSAVSGRAPQTHQGQPMLEQFPGGEAMDVGTSPPAFLTAPPPAMGLQPSPLPAAAAGPLPVPPGLPFDPRQPLMSYTRMFDGADPKLTARLRDYVELSGDLRAGGWQSHLYRSEDFIRFTAHVMIVEMLQLHGGQAEKRVVFKLRKYR